jgi:hypothetical protein
MAMLIHISPTVSNKQKARLNCRTIRRKNKPRGDDDVEEHVGVGVYSNILRFRL